MLQNESYSFECSQDQMRYFCLEQTHFGAVLHCGRMFALTHVDLHYLQDDIQQLSRGSRAIYSRSEISSNWWRIEFSAPQLVLAGYQWISVPTNVALLGGIEDLPWVYGRFRTLFSKDELPFKKKKGD